MKKSKHLTFVLTERISWGIMETVISVVVFAVIGAGLVKMWRDGKKKDALTILAAFAFILAMIVFASYMSRGMN